MPMPEDARQAAIDHMTAWLTQAGVSPEDAQLVAPSLVDGSNSADTG